MAFHLRVPSAFIMTHAGHMQPLLRRYYREACWFKGLHTRVLIPHLWLTLKTLAGPGQDFCLDPKVKSLRGAVISPFINCICLALGWVVLFSHFEATLAPNIEHPWPLRAIIWSPSPFPPGEFCLCP